jgi:hypothetical protein
MVLYSFAASALNPDTTEESAWTVYQIGLARIFASVIGLIGSGIVLVTMLVGLSRRPQVPAACPACGAIPPSPDDRFCRACGSPLIKRGRRGNRAKL